MNPKIHRYTGHVYVDGPSVATVQMLAEDPPTPDLGVRMAEGVYAFQPLTVAGRRFVAGRDELYQGDELRVSSAQAISVFDAIFDEGLTVV